MAIDSVGGSSRDAGETIRQKRMQEERAADMKRAEERRQDEMEKLVLSRENELQNLYESSTRDIEGKRRDSENRIEQAKSVAENRSKQYETETRKLTEDAKRQFQTKAVQLQKSAQELESQRAALLKQHEAAMDRIRANSENSESESSLRASREAAQAHIQQARRIDDINEKGIYEATRVQDTIDDRKRTIVNEGAQKLEALKINAADNQNQITKSIEFDKRAGAEQLLRERENLKTNQQRLEMDADDRATRLSLDNQRMLNHQHSEGSRKLMETQNGQAHELEGARKHSRDQMRELQSRTAFAMNTITAEAQSQEDIARRGYDQQRQILSAARNKAIEDNSQASQALQKKLAAEYEIRGKAYTASKDKTLLAQMTNDDKELKFHRDIGREQLNQTIAKNAERVASHESRAAADAFYRVHTINARVDDRETEYVVTMPVPPHEHENVRISLQRNSITLSGTRRFDNKVNLEDGHQATTSSYQSYTESFPVRGKLEMNNMTRDYADGVLTFRIPKG